MEQEEKDGKIRDGDKVIWGAEVEFMSLVSTPAVTDSEFLQLKSKAKDPDKIMVKGRIPLLRRKSQDNPDDRIVYAPALIPDKADGNHEAISKEEIKKAAIKYMEHYRKVDNEHTFMDGDGVPIFSWVLQKDEVFTKLDGNEKMYPEGTWMMGIKVMSDKVWDMIKSGERTGFSIAGSWKVLEIKSKGPGGHTPDGTGPHGIGAGPGNGQGNGSGMDENDDEDDDDSRSSPEKEQLTHEVKRMEEEEFMKLFEKAYSEMKRKEAEEQSQKEADEEKSKMRDELDAVKKELEELKAQKEAEAPEDSEKKEDDEEEDGTYEEEEEKEDDEDEEDDEKKKVAQKASKSYDTKLSEDAATPPETEKPKQSKGVTTAKITVKREPLGDINHE